MSTRRRSYTSTRSTARTMCATRRRISKKSTCIDIFLIHLFRILSILSSIVCDRPAIAMMGDSWADVPLDRHFSPCEKSVYEHEACFSLLIYIKENLTFNAIINVYIFTYTYRIISFLSFDFFPLVDRRSEFPRRVDTERADIVIWLAIQVGCIIVSAITRVSIDASRLKKKKGSFFQSITSLQKNSAKVHDISIWYSHWYSRNFCSSLHDIRNTGIRYVYLEISFIRDPAITIEPRLIRFATCDC